MKKLLLFSLLFITACADAGPSHTLPAPSFRRYQPIYLNVSNIEVVEEYKSPMTKPNVEHDMPYSPADAVHIWVKDRLRAVGGTKTLQVIVKDGSVVSRALPTKGGLSGLFTIEQDKEYVARLEVEMRVYGDAPLSEANVSVIGNRMVTISEDASVREREIKYQELIRQLMAETNAELEKNIYQYLSDYLNYSKSP